MHAKCAVDESTFVSLLLIICFHGSCLDQYCGCFPSSCLAWRWGLDVSRINSIQKTEPFRIFISWKDIHNKVHSDGYLIFSNCILNIVLNWGKSTMLRSCYFHAVTQTWVNNLETACDLPPACTYTGHPKEEPGLPKNGWETYHFLKCQSSIKKWKLDEVQKKPCLPASTGKENRCLFTGCGKAWLILPALSGYAWLMLPGRWKIHWQSL